MTVGLVLALGLAGCEKGQWPTDVTCPADEAPCRARGAVRWSVPVDLPLLVAATEEHGLLEFLRFHDGTTSEWSPGREPEDSLFVGAADVVYLRVNGQAVVVSADTGVVEYQGEAAGYEVPEAETDLDWPRITAKDLGFAVDALRCAEGSPIVDDGPLYVAVGCADMVSNGHGPSGGAPTTIGHCTAPVLFAINS